MINIFKICTIVIFSVLLLLFKYESTSHGNKKPVFHQSQYIQSVLKFEV